MTMIHRPGGLLPLFLFVASIATAQTGNEAPKLSPLTHRYLRDAKQWLDAERKAGDGVLGKKGVGNDISLGGLIKVRPGIDEGRLRALGIRIGTKAGAIWTVRVPLAQVEAFTTLGGIEYIQLDDPAVPTLDSARRSTRVDSVHAGYGLPMPYNGENVVVGVVDAGFDYRHPTLLDTAGMMLRVKRVWEQKNTAGTPPAGFLYGTEMTDSAEMWAKGTDNGQTHGTHVAGICAGSGFGSSDNRRYRGMAYKSDLVLVAITPDESQWINTGASDMIDGINYIFSYAGSIGRPAVVNLSWGSPLGPHDGSGLFSQALDNLTGPGRIFVCSAGNNGENRVHVRKDFTASDTVVQTFLKIAETPVGKRTWVDIWGDSSKTFCVQVSLYKDSTAIATTGFICLDDTTRELYLLGSNNDTCFIDVTTSSSEFNGKPRIFLDVRSGVSDDINIALKGNSGTVHMWDSFVHKTTGYYGEFVATRKGAINGNNDLTISDIASSRSAITVGAYASKTSWVSVAKKSFSYNSYVTRGKLVPFSSHGPTVDGRVKPDIAGPGLTVGSAISSYDTTFFSTSDSTALTEIYLNPVDGRKYPYGQLSGTSMSSPAVAGIVGLMLQIKPDLTPQQIKEIFARTAIRDNGTGNIPQGGNSTWGNGKVNAYGAVRQVLQLASTGGDERVSEGMQCRIYPNPARGTFSVAYRSKEAGHVDVEIVDLLGRPILSDRWGVVSGDNVRQYDLKSHGAGIYFITLSSRNRYFPASIVVE